MQPHASCAIVRAIATNTNDLFKNIHYVPTTKVQMSRREVGGGEHKCEVSLTYMYSTPSHAVAIYTYHGKVGTPSAT